MLQNPPTFKISSKCCKYAKKDVSKQLAIKYGADLQIVGIRRAEGGIRAQAYKNCFSINDKKADFYRPIYWYSSDTKKEYENKFNLKHSECYTKYGFIRTGCACCPYANKRLKKELEITEKYEPLLYKAVNNVFKESYEYTRKYFEFVAQEKNKKKEIGGQMFIDDYF